MPDKPGERSSIVIKNVQIVSVPVEDQERAKTFYVDTLGFELRADNSWGEGMRWVEVAPRGSSTSLSLVTWFESMPAGSLQGLVVAADDVHATYDKLAAKGVTFDSSLMEQPWGTEAVFRDPDGNGLVLSGP
jgi:catechol 2,3-dioxygenase-like lactoylglutathione lyase family enzyme